MSAVLEQAGEPVVRPMREADLVQVLEIERAAYGFPWSEAIFRDCLRVGYCCWLLERGDRVDAYGILQIGAGEAHVLNLCVRPDSWRQGLGRTLLARLIDVARGHGARSALLEVRPSNAPAIALYSGAGFTEIGMRRAYYPGHDGREDALVLERRLD